MRLAIVTGFGLLLFMGAVVYTGILDKYFVPEKVLVEVPLKTIEVEKVVEVEVAGKVEVVHKMSALTCHALCFGGKPIPKKEVEKRRREDSTLENSEWLIRPGETGSGSNIESDGVCYCYDRIRRPIQ